MTIQSVAVGIHVPSVSGASWGTGEAYAEFFRHVEALGLEAIWTEDRIFHHANLLHSVLLLTWATANSRHILLGTG
jgi:alkanesulfonate monooxygenase SsuD/methylene tetrahydromethanopterin reductase-like flavin-dependent oxidoreductase (luciferase family)